VDVTWLKGRLARAQPADILFLAYVAFTGLVILLFGWKLTPRLWIGLIALHVGMLVAGLWWAGQRVRAPSAGGFIRDIFPLVFIAPLYWELRFLAQLFSRGYNDVLILSWEEALFGEQLAVTLSQHLPYFWLSELMHFFYAMYWALLPLAAAMLYSRRRFEGLRELVFVESVVFFSCYLVYIFFPVTGPFYQFPEIGGHLASGPMYRFVHWVLTDGGSMGAAFPSSHVAVAVTIVLVAWRHDRLVRAVMLPLVVGLTISTVYGRFHYGIDALAGVLMALALLPGALWLRRWLTPRGVAEVGNSEPAPPV
jgi:membrane-associated phospholipid phosphatase